MDCVLHTISSICILISQVLFMIPHDSHVDACRDSQIDIICINLRGAKMQHDTTWVDIISANIREQDIVIVRDLVRSLHPPATPCSCCYLEFHLQSKPRCVPTIASAVRLVVVLSSLLAASTDWSPRSENRRLAERRSSEIWKQRLNRTQWNHNESWSKEV